MKKSILILGVAIGLISCNNQNSPSPQTQSSTTHSVQVVNPSGHAIVYINNVSQGYPNHVFYVVTGDVFKYVDTGDDTSTPFVGVNQGLINCEVYVDGAKVYSYNGYNDVIYTYTAN
jgi:hypothetical protein